MYRSIRFVLPGLAVSVSAACAQTSADSAAIRATALDYVEGWYAGDAARMERALHPELAKRIVNTNPQTGRSTLDHQTATMLVQSTRRGGGSSTPSGQMTKEVTILDIYRNTASVRADMSDWIDYMHMAKWNGRWVIVNVLWELKPQDRLDGSLAVQSPAGAVTQDRSKPVGDALEQQYARIAEAYLRRTPGVVLALRMPDFSVSLPNGERWDTNQSAAYVIAGFEQMERTLAASFTIAELNVRGDTAAAFIHQRWSRLQRKAGRVRRVETSACQRETWINTAAGWRLHLVDRIQPLVWAVDGRRIDPAQPYDPSAPAYAPTTEPDTPCTTPDSLRDERKP